VTIVTNGDGDGIDGDSDSDSDSGDDGCDDNSDRKLLKYKLLRCLPTSTSSLTTIQAMGM